MGEDEVRWERLCGSGLFGWISTTKWNFPHIFFPNIPTRTSEDFGAFQNVINSRDNSL